MRSFLGTGASLGSDLSLISALIFGLAAIVGGINGRRRRISRHCPVMAAAALLNWVPALLVMVPKWLGVAAGTASVQSGLPTVVPLFHGVLGSVVQLLMTYTVARMYWLERLPPEETVWLMRTTIALWLLTVIGGVGVYLTLYAV